jgi:hypothetical protein
MKRAYVWLVSLCVCAAALSGCGAPSDTPEDSTTPSLTEYDSPNHYTNFATTCDGPNKVYITYNYDNIFVVPNDPSCGGS